MSHSVSVICMEYFSCKVKINYGIVNMVKCNSNRLVKGNNYG